MKSTSAPEANWVERLPWPDAGAHKHSRGRLGVVSGGPLNTGAARLAARAGLRIGAGLVQIFAPAEAAPIVAGSVEAVMVADFSGPDALARLAEPFDAVVIGPAAGLAETTAYNLAALGRTGAVLIVDADALTLFKGRAHELFDHLDRDDVLTPHEGEFERLFPGLLAEGRETAARRAAERANAVVLLKGPETVIAAPDGRFAINPNGTPWLATAGSGDVLAGLVGGLVAQRMDSFDAACASAWIHAETARGFGPGLISENLPDRVPAVLSALFPG